MKYVLDVGYCIIILMELCVVANLYNANILDYFDVPDPIEYSLWQVPILFITFLDRYGFGNYVDAFEWTFPLFCWFMKFQWFFHSPFEEWRLVKGKSEGDLRHRTEYYDTHVVIFAAYLILFVRRWPRHVEDD